MDLQSKHNGSGGSEAFEPIELEGDGVVDWRYCKTDLPGADSSVSGEGSFRAELVGGQERRLLLKAEYENAIAQTP